MYRASNKIQESMSNELIFPKSLVADEKNNYNIYHIDGEEDCFREPKDA